MMHTKVTGICLYFYYFFKVALVSNNSEVTVETVEGVNDHLYYEDTDAVDNPSANLRWSPEMTKIVMEGVIKRNLKNANVLGSKVPSKTQLYNKIAAP